MNFKCLLMVAIAMVASIRADDGNALSAVARSSQLFAASVYQQMKSEPGNLLICPVSVQTVLALVQAGAKSETSDEIQRALFLPADKSTVQQGFEKLMNTLNNAKNVEMDIANKVYVKEGYKVSNNFKQIATKSFDAGIQDINFEKNVEAAKEINQWVEEKTHDKIKDLISPDDLDALTRMVLVNALYFKGNWTNKFDKYATHDGDFYVSAAKPPVKVPMMSVTDNFQYAENEALDCKFLQMTYTGNEYAMTIVLPNKKDGLPELENRLIEALGPQEYKNERVEVLLPKFSIETTIQFKDILKKLGMVKPFNRDADFSGLLDSPEALYISKVIQKNFINVTEDGTEAASATAVDLLFRSGLIPPRDSEWKFYADHPYLYTIKEVNTNAILFIGRYESMKDVSIKSRANVEADNNSDNTATDSSTNNSEATTMTNKNMVTDNSSTNTTNVAKDNNSGANSVYLHSFVFILLATFVHLIF